MVVVVVVLRKCVCLFKSCTMLLCSAVAKGVAMESLRCSLVARMLLGGCYDSTPSYFCDILVSRYGLCLSLNIQYNTI